MLCVANFWLVCSLLTGQDPRTQCKLQGVTGSPCVYQPLNAALQAGAPEPRPGWRGVAWLEGRQPGGAGDTASEGETQGHASPRTGLTSARLQRLSPLFSTLLLMAQIKHMVLMRLNHHHKT